MKKHLLTLVALAAALLSASAQGSGYPELDGNQVIIVHDDVAYTLQGQNIKR